MDPNWNRKMSTVEQFKDTAVAHNEASKELDEKKKKKAGFHEDTQPSVEEQERDMVRGSITCSSVS